MGFYNDRENYLRSLCIADADIAHLNPVAENSEDLRQSFFRINDAEEILEASVNWIHFPCVVMAALSGMDTNKGGSIRQVNSNSWMILSKKLYGEEGDEASAITGAYDLTFNIMMRLKRKLYDDSEEDICGAFLDVDRFKWDSIGPFADGLYGWVLTFTDETRPKI
jgi:hypothetical protein